MEALEDINKVTFDKKGTLAHGMFVVHHLEHIQKPRKEALQLPTLMECPPLMETLVKSTRKEGVTVRGLGTPFLTHHHQGQRGHGNNPGEDSLHGKYVAF